jgi:hypothetical protein
MIKNECKEFNANCMIQNQTIGIEKCINEKCIKTIECRDSFYYMRE